MRKKGGGKEVFVSQGDVGQEHRCRGSSWLVREGSNTQIGGGEAVHVWLKGEGAS